MYYCYFLFRNEETEALERLIVYLGLYSTYTLVYPAFFVCFLKEWAGQTIFNDFQDAFVVDICVVPEG